MRVLRMVLRDPIHTPTNEGPSNSWQSVALNEASAVPNIRGKSLFTIVYEPPWVIVTDKAGRSIRTHESNVLEMRLECDEPAAKAEPEKASDADRRRTIANRVA